MYNVLYISIYKYEEQYPGFKIKKKITIVQHFI